MPDETPRRPTIDPALIKTLSDWIFKIGAVLWLLSKSYWGNEALTAKVASLEAAQEKRQEMDREQRDRLKGVEVKIEDLQREQDSEKQFQRNSQKQ